MSLEYYVLTNNKQIQKATLEQYNDYFNRAAEGSVPWRVQLEKTEDSEVSTVFLGLNHNWSGGAPVLFETMVMGGPMAGEQDRYCTWAEAEQGHKQMVERVRLAEVNLRTGTEKN
jgi:hypothetical protein